MVHKKKIPKRFSQTKYLKKLSKKIVQEDLGQQNFESKKKFGSKKCWSKKFWGHKYFGSEKILGPNNLPVKTVLLGPTNFWSKNFGSKKIIAPKT